MNSPSGYNKVNYDTKNSKSYKSNEDPNNPLCSITIVTFGFCHFYQIML